MKHAWMAVAALTLTCSAAWPQTHAHKPGAQKSAAAERAFGKAGDLRKITLVVRVEMADTMRFSPSEITVKSGDTVHFEARNAGKVMHEVVLGTMEGLKEHAASMRKHSGMKHDEPHMAHVAPGKTGSIVWQFTRPGEFYYACLVPGHFEAGMVGKIKVEAR